MELEDDDEFFQDFVKDVLDKATVVIVEKLEPKGLLDIFEQRKTFEEATNVNIRDIKNERTTSDQNRAIRELVRRSGNYIIFKEELASTGQQELLHDLEAIEKEIHDSLEEPPHHCDSAESCDLLQQVKHQQLKILSPTSKIIQGLQQHLIYKYRKENMYWKNPMTAEEAYLSEMYVQPSVSRVREINEHGETKEVKKHNSLPSKLIYEDIFKSKTGGFCKNIYITGEAGAGKSTFCNQLVLNWCSSVQNEPANYLPSEDHKLLSSFSFLFHIKLRETETIYHVDNMIQEQLLFDAPGDLNISDILKTERCLIILDGLDEWLCPDNAMKCPNINKNIPGRNMANENCVFITTSKDWKVDLIGLRNKNIDKHVEIMGINRDESVELTKRMLNHLDRDLKSSKTVDDFLTDVRKRKLSEFLSVPVLLIQLITMWFLDKDFGNSQLQLYCNMLDLLFEGSEKHLPEEISKRSSTAVAIKQTLPECFRTNDNCQKYAELLNCLAKLAYKALFNAQKEEALIFKSSRFAIFGITPSDIKLCLHCGILFQYKDCGNRIGQFKKFSFLHKKVQECVAAIYLVTNDTVEDILKDVKQFCNSVNTILDMNQVWLFVAAMDHFMTRRLFEHLFDVVSDDEQVKTYRQTIDGGKFSCSRRLVERIQKCVSDCVSEGFSNGYHYENLSFEDFYINADIVCDVERLLFYSDMSQVKSVYIYTRNIDAANVAAITGQFLQCRSLQKLNIHDYSSRIPDSTMAALVKNNHGSLTTLNLGTKIKATDKLVTIICGNINKSLMAFGLHYVKLTHEHIEQILHSLSKFLSIRQLELIELNCTDHGDECIPRIDLSSMTQLRELSLYSSMYVDNLQSLSYCVEKVGLWYVTIPVTSLRYFARELSQTGRDVTVQLYSVQLTGRTEECGDFEDFLLNCPGLEVTRCWCFDEDIVINFNTIRQ